MACADAKLPAFKRGRDDGSKEAGRRQGAEGSATAARNIVQRAIVSARGKLETMTQQRSDRLLPADRVKVTLLICIHTLICCISLAVAAGKFDTAAAFHIFYDPGRLPSAVIAVAAFALVSIVFSISPASALDISWVSIFIR